jgi:hypothetical protein
MNRSPPARAQVRGVSGILYLGSVAWRRGGVAEARK